jgi:hypothetical protein
LAGPRLEHPGNTRVSGALNIEIGIGLRGRGVLDGACQAHKAAIGAVLNTQSTVFVRQQNRVGRGLGGKIQSRRVRAGQLGQLAGPKGVRQGGDAQARVHFAVPAGRTGGRAADVHRQVQVLIPVNRARKSRDRTQADRQITVYHLRALAGAVQVIFGPQRRAAAGNAIQLELDVVVTVVNDGAGAGLQSGLEVNRAVGAAAVCEGASCTPRLNSVKVVNSKLSARARV